MLNRVDVCEKLSRHLRIRNAKLHLVRLAPLGSIPSPHHSSIPTASNHTLLIVPFIVMARTRSIGGENDFCGGHDRGDRRLVLVGMYWELFHLEKWTSMG